MTATRTCQYPVISGVLLTPVRVLGGILLGTALMAAGGEPSAVRTPAIEGMTNAPLRQISASVFELGGVRFDKILRTATIPACVNMREGPVEYLLVGKSGKLHESVFRTDAEPACVHAAMLFIGARGAPEEPAPLPDAGSFYIGPGKESAGSSTNTVPFLAKGDAIAIQVSWQLAGEGKTARGEDCVWNRKTRSPMNAGNWTYTGSRIVNGTFLAQRDQSLVSIVPDPSALVNNPRADRQDDEIWEVHSKILPPTGTAVQIVIRLEDVKKPSPK